MRLDGKLGMVTAAASGIGRAGAIRFAQEGAHVAVVDIDSAGVEEVVDEIRSNGGLAVGIVADLTKDEASYRIVHEAADQLGGLDFAWNNVGHPGPAKVEDMDMSSYDLAMTLNVRSQILSTDLQLKELRKRGGGTLLYTASTAGVFGSPNSPVYSAAKHATVGFVRSLAKRVGKDNIRVNAICPGRTRTPMLRQFVARPDQESTIGKDPDKVIEETDPTANALGRSGEPMDMANAALFLVSDEASFVTGARLSVDGGSTA